MKKEPQKRAPPMGGKEVRKMEESESKLAREKEFAAVAERAAIIDVMPDALLMLDLNGTILLVNPAMTKMLGYTPEERIGKSFDELTDSIRAEDIEKFMKLLGELIEGDEVRPVETVLRAKDGREIPTSVTYSLIKDTEGNPKNIIAILRDITELKRAEEERVAAIKGAIDTIDAMIDPLIVLSLDGEIIYANPAHLKKFGHESIDELKGRSIEAVSDAFVNPEEDMPKMLELFRGVIEKGYTEKPPELNLKRPDGTQEFIVSATAALLKDADGNPKNIIATLRDITELKQAQEKEKEASAVAAAARAAIDTIDAMGDGLVLIDVDGKITAVNPAFEKMLGYDKNKLVGKNASELMPKVVKPEDMEKALGALGTTMEGKVAPPVIITLISKDGQEIPSAITGSFIRDTEGKPTTIIVTIKDITELKQLEERLRMVQKMEALGRMTGGIAHDFNNLLTAITGFSDLIKSQLKEDDPIGQDVEEIQNAADQAALLIRRLMAFSRKQVLQPKVLDLNEVVSGTEKLLRRIIGEDIEFVARYGENLERTKADPGQIEQVILNLVVNARDAMTDGGRITIQTRNVLLDKSSSKIIPEALAGKFVLLTVEDTGKGMSKETVEHIFEPFFTTKKNGEGTGLGLSTVYGTVKQHGGWINVYSEPGHGTVFKVYLPAFLVGRPAQRRKNYH